MACDPRLLERGVCAGAEDAAAAECGQQCLFPFNFSTRTTATRRPRPPLREGPLPPTSPPSTPQALFSPPSPSVLQSFSPSRALAPQARRARRRHYGCGVAVQYGRRAGGEFCSRGVRARRFGGPAAAGGISVVRAAGAVGSWHVWQVLWICWAG